MKKLIWFTTAVVLFLIFIVPAILALGLKLIPGSDQPSYNSDQRLSIYLTRGVTQKFVSQEANLSAIGTSIRNPNLKNKKDIILNLMDENMKVIRTSVINGQNVQDGDFVKFIFDPISDSANKTYFFTLASPEAGPEETIEVFYTQSPPSWIEDYIYDNTTYPGGIPIVLYFKPTSKVTVIKEIYSNLFSRLLPLNFHKS
jgi:hypothetical protein